MKLDIEKIKAKKNMKELLKFGIINIDKPSGPTSFQVSEYVKKILGLRKTSHFGTLDPKVTGVLPVALNRACKLTGYFLGEDKTYIGIMSIHEEINIEEVKKIIEDKFTGKITQMPPVKSRVKRQEREREVKKFDILEKDEKEFLFLTKVQGGTYIRKLIHDLGEELKIGAHMLELRRIKAGIFSEDNKKYPSVTMYDLEKAVDEYKKGDEKPLKEIIIPAEIVGEIYETVEIQKESVDRILHGQPIYYKNLVRDVKLDKGKIISIFCEDRFVGMFRVTGENEFFARNEFTMQEIKS